MLRRFIALLFLTITFSAVSSVISQTQQKGREFLGATFRVNQYGVLVELKDTNGENYFGKNTPPPHDGYAVAYQVLDPKTRKPMKDPKTGKENLQIVYATSDKISADLLKVLDSGKSLSGEIKPDVKGCEKEKAENHCKLLTAEVRTSDGILQIANEFWGLGPKKEIGIARRIKNISTKPIFVIGLELQLDGRFPIFTGKNTSSHHLLNTATNRRIVAALVSGSHSTGPIVCPPLGPLGPGPYPPEPEWCPACQSWFDSSPLVLYANNDSSETAFATGQFNSMPKLLREKSGTNNITVHWYKGRDPVLSDLLPPGRMITTFHTPKLLRPDQ